MQVLFTEVRKPGHGKGIDDAPQALDLPIIERSAVPRDITAWRAADGEARRGTPRAHNRIVRQVHSPTFVVGKVDPGPQLEQAEIVNIRPYRAMRGFVPSGSGVL